MGGSNDPVDAYPIVTKGKSVITITGSKGALQAYLMRGSSLGALGSLPPRMLAAASTHAAGHTLHLRVPKKGSWYVVVTAAGATSALGYTLRVP